MTVEERIETTKLKVKYYICDICGLDTKIPLLQCSICGKHICAKCCSDKNNYISTFSIRYCKTCFDLKENYELKIERLEDKFDEFSKLHIKLIQKQEELKDNTINELKHQWKNESLGLTDDET